MPDYTLHLYTLTTIYEGKMFNNFFMSQASFAQSTLLRRTLVQFIQDFPTHDLANLKHRNID